MNFSWFFSKKIAWGKASRNQLSRTIVRIGQAAVAIGIIVALVTLSTGIGARKEIKQKLADFNGHITVKPYSSNLSLNSDSISLPQAWYPNFPSKEIEHIQAVATKNGIIRTQESFDGVLLKGVDEHYDVERFQKFMRKGAFPKITSDSISSKVVISQKLANEFYLDIDSSFVMVFVNENLTSSQPIYRKFQVSGIYSTDIKQFDDLYVLGDIKQVQRINRWPQNQVGSFAFVPDVEVDLRPIKQIVNEQIGFNLMAEAATDVYSDINEWIQIFDTNIQIILFIMMIVVVINMIMILLILILERTHSIGVLKTLGAQNWQIQKIFVNYALFIMLPGLIIGNVIGIGLLLVQKYFGVIQLPPENYFISKAPVYISWDMVILVNVFSLLISALILFLPSLLVTRISPTRAMKVK